MNKSLTLGDYLAPFTTQAPTQTVWTRPQIKRNHPHHGLTAQVWDDKRGDYAWDEKMCPQCKVHVGPKHCFNCHKPNCACGIDYKHAGGEDGDLNEKAVVLEKKKEYKRMYPALPRSVEHPQCPVCQEQIPQAQLHQHVEAHFADEQKVVKITPKMYWCDKHNCIIKAENVPRHRKKCKAHLREHTCGKKRPMPVKVAWHPLSQPTLCTTCNKYVDNLWVHQRTCDEFAL